MPADTVRPPQAEIIYPYSIEITEYLRSFIGCSVRLNVHSPMRAHSWNVGLYTFLCILFELFRETYVYSSAEAHSWNVSLCTFLCILLNL